MPTVPPSKRSKTAPATATGFLHHDIEEERLKPYVVTGHLGRGSFATVYKGLNEVRLLTHPLRAPR